MHRRQTSHMQTSPKWAAACCGLSLLPAFATTATLFLLQSVYAATYDLAYKGLPLPFALPRFLAGPFVPWLLLAIPTLATAAFMLRRRFTVESVVLMVLGNVVYAWLLVLSYLAIAVRCLLSWNAVPLSS